MKRRSYAHNYSHTGIYHITISVAKGLWQPFGRICGQLEKPDEDRDAPHVELSPIGRMVEKELQESIHRFYPMLEVQDYVVMPEHLHFLLVAHGDVISLSGKLTHLGHVIAGFKYGCNKQYWAMTGKMNLATESPGTLKAMSIEEPRGTQASTKVPGTLEVESSGRVLGDSVAGLLLLVTPWSYHYRPHGETISVPFCKTMNCIAQAICKLKDDWWKK